MNGFKLFTIRGIEVKMHITFPLILVWAAVQFGFLNQRAFSPSGAAFGIVITLLLFACVMIHELSHSLTAARMGFPVRDIVLLPLGGVSQMERMPERPTQEFLMAVAGPLSNVVIAAVLVVVGLFFARGPGQRPAQSDDEPHPAGLGGHTSVPGLYQSRPGHL